VCGFIFQGLRRHLLEELEQTFPDEVESYREIRAASAAVSNFLYRFASITFLLLTLIFCFAKITRTSSQVPNHSLQNSLSVLFEDQITICEGYLFFCQCFIVIIFFCCIECEAHVSLEHTGCASLIP